MLPSATLSLQITQQHAKIGLEIHDGQFQMRQPKAELEIRQQPAHMEIEQRLGDLQIDREEARAALGYKTSSRMSADLAAQVRQIVLDTISDYAEEGDQLAAVETGVTFADIALRQQEKGPMPIRDYGPPANIIISYVPHPARIRWEQGDAFVRAVMHPPEIQYQIGKVDVYLRQKNWLTIDVKGKYLNMTF